MVEKEVEISAVHNSVDVTQLLEQIAKLEVIASRDDSEREVQMRREDQLLFRIRDLGESLDKANARNAELQTKLTVLNAPFTNPFKCGHAARFVWTDPSGVKACAACRMFAAERLERELAVALENCTILDREAQEHLDRLGY